MTYICVGNLTIIGSDQGSAPGRHWAIIWTNDGILLMGLLGTNFSEILIEIYTFSFKTVHLKISSGKWRPFCLGLNVLNPSTLNTPHILQNKLDVLIYIIYLPIFLSKHMKFEISSIRWLESHSTKQHASKMHQNHENIRIQIFRYFLPWDKRVKFKLI